MTAVLAGAYDTRVGKLPDQSTWSLAANAADGALRDAGLRLDQVDALITTPPVVDSRPRQALALAESLGIIAQLAWANTMQLGGASPLAAVVEATRLVDDHVAERVLVVAADTPRTGQSRHSTVSSFAQMRHPDWEQPYGTLNVTAYALLASEYLRRHGVDESMLAEPAVAMRAMAAGNPAAVYRDPLTAADVMDSRPVSDPLRLLECCPISDGAAAIVVTRRGDAPRVRGWGHGYTHDSISFARTPVRTGCATAARRALDMAGVQLDRVDVALLYDSYTIAVLVELEEIGACAPGAAGKFVASGAIGRDGVLPVNPHGGLLSHAHTGGAAGMHHVVEAVRQLCGTAANQIDQAGTVFIHGEGGILSAHCAAVLSY